LFTARSRLGSPDTHPTDQAPSHPNCGSYEVQFPDGRASAHFYFEDNADRRLRPEQLTREQALDGARAAGGDQSVFK
jgi:hypothetical protein